MSMSEALAISPQIAVPRVTVDEVKAPIDRGKPKAWSESDVKIRGALRVLPRNDRAGLSCGRPFVQGGSDRTRPDS